MMNPKGIRQLIAVLVALMMIAGLSGYLPMGSVYAGTDDTGFSVEEPFSDDSLATEDEGANPYEILAFTSDIHNAKNHLGVERLDTWIDNIRNCYGGLDCMGFCGDMAYSYASVEDYWNLAQLVMDEVENSRVTGFYTTGNHEYDPGRFDTTTNDTTARFMIDTEVAAEEHYRIYCLGSGPQYGTYTQEQITKLNAYLKEAADEDQDNRPIIIMTHYPLHSYGTRLTKNASDVIEVLNSAAVRGQTIVFLWGHNHTKADLYYDHMYVPGDSIEYNPGNRETIWFYYGAAGCMSDAEHSKGSAAVEGKGLVIRIENDNRLWFTYHKANGEPLDSSQYTVRFVDENNNILKSGRYYKGDIPAYPDEVPLKAENSQYSYTFTGWSDGTKTYGVNETLPAVEGSVMYTAKFRTYEKPAYAIQRVRGTLLAAMKSSGRNSLAFSWLRVQNADGYDVFLARGKGTQKYERVLSVKSGGVLKGTVKGLNKKTAYKGYVKAYIMINGEKRYVRTSPTVYAYTTGGSKTITNPKSVKVQKTKVSLKKGKTYKTKATVKKLRDGKKLIGKGFAPKLRYISSDTGIAKVTKAGKIIAVGKGKCKVYVYAVNGVRKTVKVTVK